MKVWETNVLQVKSDLQYIVYISHFISEFVIKPASYLAFTSKTIKANGFISKLFFNINLLGYM